MKNNIYVYIKDMPSKVHEAVVPCISGYTVYINSKLSRLGQEEAYIHALRHIESDDFWNEEDIQAIEARAHRR